MSTPPTTTTIAVAVTMTLAAVRTEGGSRRNRDIRRSIGFGWRLSVPMARSSVDWLAIITDANGSRRTETQPAAVSTAMPCASP